MFFVNGITGAGKSSAVSGVLARLCSDKIFFVTAAN
jgi:type II secretory ATPase GspE/PulE/Tfp pilus assembly ATPase PilB-like protein